MDCWVIRFIEKIYNQVIQKKTLLSYYELLIYLIRVSIEQIIWIL